MKFFLVLALMSLSFTALANELLNETNFVRLDVESNEISVFIPDGHCTIQIISNLNPLYDSATSSSPVGPQLKDALEVSKGEINFVKRRLAVDLSRAHHGGFGSFVRVKTKSGRNLKDVIQEIIPNQNGEESNMILTLIGNDSNERRCSFN